MQHHLSCYACCHVILSKRCVACYQLLCQCLFPPDVDLQVVSGGLGQMASVHHLICQLEFMLQLCPLPLQYTCLVLRGPLATSKLVVSAACHVAYTPHTLIASLPAGCRVMSWQCFAAAGLFSIAYDTESCLVSLLYTAMATSAAPVRSP